MSSANTWQAEAFRSQVQSALDEFADLQADRNLELGPDAAVLLDAARKAVRGGKRLRAMFCYWGFRAVRPVHDEAEDQLLVRACAAVELLHASALVHDDYMDASDTRRGGPATHRAFAGAHRSAGWRGNPEQYGAAAAILLGDLLLAWSDELLRTAGFPLGDLGPAMRCFDTMRTEVILGQFLDVSLQARGDTDVEKSMRVLRYKSAKYSVERPLHLGASLAGASPRILDELSAYGLPLGEAFQLRDDLLGVFGDPEVTGKPAGDDLAEGKRTVLVALALAALQPSDAEALDDALGRPLQERDIVELQRMIERSGAHADVERRIEALTQQCLSALTADGAGLSPDARTALRELAAAATQRVV